MATWRSGEHDDLSWLDWWLEMVRGQMIDNIRSDVPLQRVPLCPLRLRGLSHAYLDVERKPLYLVGGARLTGRETHAGRPQPNTHERQSGLRRDPHRERSPAPSPRPVRK
jgi:hypothetical protein